MALEIIRNDIRAEKTDVIVTTASRKSRVGTKRIADRTLVVPTVMTAETKPEETMTNLVMTFLAD